MQIIFENQRNREWQPVHEEGKSILHKRIDH